MTGRIPMGAAALALLLGGCGSTPQERAGTAALAGIGIGALAGGPIGAVVGAGVGAAAGAAAPAGIEQAALFGNGRVDVSRPEPLEGGTLRPKPPRPPESADASPDHVEVARVSRETGRKLQEALRAEGLYDGPIDGLVGPQTTAALAAYRVKRGRAPWPVLDVPTIIDLIGPQPQQAAVTSRAEVP
jgi:peptidoglycan hydrolase-like protein with peptidoglycan-binding domain